MALEKILIVGVAEIIKQLLPIIDEHISPLAWGVKDDLRKLKLALESIQAAVSDAEINQANSESARLWLRRLKDVVYDADDVMDQYSYEYMRRDEDGSQLHRKVRDFVSYSSSNPLVFRFRISRKIRAINKTLDEIHKDDKRYNKPNTTSGVNVPQSTVKSNLQTSSKGDDDSVILGREEAKSEIISMMLTSGSSPATSGNSSQQGKPSIVSIVGMGGLGKTTLAQQIYKFSNLGNFDSKAWVCVSDNFHIFNILVKMMESINGTKFDRPSSLDALGVHITEKLKGKIFLLVLDDLWNEDSRDWEELMKLLVCGAKSINILITTRKIKVASVVGGSIYPLQRLTNDTCWLIMERIITSRDERILALKKVTDIGKEIAKRCDGLPLAAKFLGSLMASNTEERYWSEIKRNINLWNANENNRLLSIIKLSYDKLPSPLKQCFSHYSMFPKGWKVEREMLIRLWIAEGFLHQPFNMLDHRSIEDVGNEYFEHLLSNSFFQEIETDELGVIMRCKMHDIVHDLAVSVADLDEYGILQSRGGNKDASKIRRLNLVFGKRSSNGIPEALSKAKKLRTVFALAPEQCSQINSFFSIKRLRVLCPLGVWGTYQGADICTWIPKLKHLRYLDLSGCRIDLYHDVSLKHCYNLLTLVLFGCLNVSTVLRKMKSLKSLRHLDLSYSDIKLLPDSIVGLTNLQTLNLHCCSQFEALPEDIGLLIHLSYLDLSNTALAKLPDSITCLSNLRLLEFPWNLNTLPREFGGLTGLRRLDVSNTKINELPESCTRTLCNLEIVKIGGNCKLPRDIKDLPKLKHFTHDRVRYGDMMPRGVEKLIYLEILESYVVRKKAAQICSGSSTRSNPICHRSGIEALEDLNSLQVLHIRSLENVIGGIEDAERAKLKDKKNLRELRLHWRYYDDEDYEDDDELYQGWWRDHKNFDMVLEGLRPPPNLRLLEIYGFSGLNLPKWMGSSCLLPNLVELHLRNCNTCEGLPGLGMLPFLRDLMIWGMDSVKCLGREFYYQQQPEEESSSCTSTYTATTSAVFPSLVFLSLRALKNLEEWVSPIPSSYSCVNSFPLLETLEMQECPKLRSAPNSFPSLKVLKLWETNGKAVNSIFSGYREQYLSSLKSIIIDKSADLVYFPLGVLLQNNTPNLHSIKFRDCSEFQGFRDDDPKNNNNCKSSLHTMELQNCPVLTSLPDLRLWNSSLRKLFIWKCDRLKESIPYRLRTSLLFLDSLQVDFIQRDNKWLEDPGNFPSSLINLMQK